MPKEFTPEVTEDFYTRLAGRIQKRGEADEGRAMSEALARGRADDLYLQSAVGGVRGRTREQLADLDADLAYKVAGMNREERLGQQEQKFTAEQAQLDREAQERAARYGYQVQREMERLRNRRGYQSALWGLGGAALGYAAGGGAGGALVGSMAGKAAGGASQGGMF